MYIKWRNNQEEDGDESNQTGLRENDAFIDSSTINDISYSYCCFHQRVWPYLAGMSRETCANGPGGEGAVTSEGRGCNDNGEVSYTGLGRCTGTIIFDNNNKNKSICG
jgi:hypothetical protein